MQRFADWPERLIDFIAERLSAPFAFGPQDCCSFAGDCALRLTGNDPMADLRGYSTLEEAARILAPGLPALVDARLPRIAPAAARRGDIGMIESKPGRRSLVIVDGADVIGPGETGLERWPRGALQAAWSVG